MDIDDILARTGGLEAMARDLGVSEADAARGAAELLPAILGGFKKQAQSQPAGLAGLGGLLAQLGGGGLLDELLAPQPTDASHGNDVLGQIFGSRDVSRAVAQNASSRSGLDQSLLKRMLPLLAMLVAGYLSRQGGAGAGAARPNAGGGLEDLVGGMLGGRDSGSSAGGLGALLDLNGDGNPLDDILRMVGKALR